MTKPDRNIVAILSADYGELFNAMYFVMGMPFKSTICATSRLYSTNQNRLPYNLCTYSSFDDLREIVEQLNPDLVLLFSGYLYKLNSLLSAEQTVDFLNYLRDRDIPYVTSDPSLGLIGNLADKPQNLTYERFRLQFEWLLPHLDIPHLYLSSVGIDCRSDSHSYFNPQLVFDDAEKNAIENRLRKSKILRNLPIWLFIMQPEDEVIQRNRYGEKTWNELLVARVAETIMAGKHAVVLAPERCLSTFAKHFIDDEAVLLLPGCHYTLFMQLLISAEYVFYWNRYSASILGRAINDGSLFCFDDGHLPLVLPDLKPIAERHFYVGSDFPNEDFTKRLDAKALAEKAATHALSLFEPLLANFSQSPTPAELTETLIAGWKANG